MLFCIDCGVPDCNHLAAGVAKWKSLLHNQRRLVDVLSYASTAHGTWNTDDGKSVTNIVEIRNCIKPTDPSGIPQRIYYEWGIGTGLFNRIRGGAFGVGLDHKVRAAYRYLSANFHDDDASTTETYIFGFSRGAYTARALAGFVGSAGLLRPEFCNAENEERVWKYYRTRPEDRMPADRIGFEFDVVSWGAYSVPRGFRYRGSTWHSVDYFQAAQPCKIRIP